MNTFHQTLLDRYGQNPYAEGDLALQFKWMTQMAKVLNVDEPTFAMHQHILFADMDLIVRQDICVSESEQKQNTQAIVTYLQHKYDGWSDVQGLIETLQQQSVFKTKKARVLHIQELRKRLHTMAQRNNGLDFCSVAFRIFPFLKEEMQAPAIPQASMYLFEMDEELSQMLQSISRPTLSLLQDQNQRCGMEERWRLFLEGDCTPKRTGRFFKSWSRLNEYERKERKMESILFYFATTYNKYPSDEEIAMYLIKTTTDSKNWSSTEGLYATTENTQVMTTVKNVVKKKVSTKKQANVDVPLIKDILWELTVLTVCLLSNHIGAERIATKMQLKAMVEKEWGLPIPRKIQKQYTQMINRMVKAQHSHRLETKSSFDFSFSFFSEQTEEDNEEEAIIGGEPS